jgi:quinoprotein glucose dehydrogenase
LTARTGKLQVAWTFETGDSTSYVFSPIVVGRTAVVLAKSGSLVGLDATTGKELWTHEFSGGRGAGGQRGINSWQSKDGSDQRIFITANNGLYAIDVKTG